MPSQPPALSIVICTRDEGRCLDATLARIGRDARAEIIVADGGSVDDTVAVARSHDAMVIDAAPGRGSQLRAGAEAAVGEQVVLLHADTILPDGYAEHVRDVLGRPGVVAGAFGLRVDGDGCMLRLLERLVAWRCRLMQTPYGDQALFMRAATLRRVGGVPPLPVMEDYELVRRLRRLGRVEIAPAHAVTSGRRWRAHGVLRTTLLNQVCIAAYRLGVDPSRIARWRDRRRSSPLAQSSASG